LKTKDSESKDRGRIYTMRGRLAVDWQSAAGCEPARSANY
jgi:hypothetical protein